MDQLADFIIYTDGAARSNPGPAAIAYVIQNGRTTLAEGKEYIGETTNNIAEYTAMIRALKHARSLGGRRLEVRSDSELLVNQLGGSFKVKNAGLKPLYDEVSRLRLDFDQVSFKYIPRAENKRADELCNEALDEKLLGGRPARKPAAAKRAPVGAAVLQNVHAEAIECLRGAARAWAHGDPNNPSADEVWEQLWAIVEEAGIVGRVRGQGE
jgi:ribonuclease HI